MSAIPIIRDFSPDDLPMLEALWLAAWQATMPEIDFAARLPWFRNHMSVLTVMANVKVALRDSRPAGFITVEPNGYVDQVVVAPEHWGSGVGAALLAEARRLSPFGLTLSVNAENPRAVAFYRRQGFIETGRGTNSGSGRPVIHLYWAGTDASA